MTNEISATAKTNVQTSYASDRTISTSNGRRPTARPRLVATYDYRDADGKMLFQVCRYVPKDFLQRKPDATAPGGWRWSTKGVEKVLFRLPEILAAIASGKSVFVCEGEKDVLNMMQKDFSATCNPGGAVDKSASKKWLDSYTETLRGADVVIIADKDSAGLTHSQLVAGKLHGAAKSVRVLELPDVNGQPVKDAADFFAAGGDAGQIVGLVDATPLWTPGAVKFPITDSSSINGAQQPLGKLGNCITCITCATVLTAPSEDELVEGCVSRNKSTSRPNLFRLARGVLTLQREKGDTLADEDLERIFGKWYEPSLPCLKPDESRQDYFDKFMEALDCAKVPLDETALAIAWSKSQTEPLPEAAAGIHSRNTQRLVALCWQLQLLVGNGNFFLSCYDAGRLLGVSHVRAWGLLRTLVDRKVLQLIQVGSVKERLASEYRFDIKPSPKGIIV